MNKAIVGLFASLFVTAAFAQTNTIGETAPTNNRPVTAAEAKSDVKGLGARLKGDVQQAGTEIKQVFKKPAAKAEAQPAKVEMKPVTTKTKAKSKKVKAKAKKAKVKAKVAVK
ncbi:MAG: hypothetical protein V4632_10220 [Pseudomonadota bacterium]